MTTESALVRTLLLAGSALGAVLFRNNVGRLRTKDGAYVQYGLCVGSSDLIGYVPVVITPDMVGRRVALFCAVECKTETGRISEDQRRFLAALERAGAVSGVARSAGDLETILAPWRRHQP